MQSATNIIAEGSEEELFKNLNAEQARHSYTNQRMADIKREGVKSSGAQRSINGGRNEKKNDVTAFRGRQRSWL